MLVGHAATMQTYARLLVITCILLCLTLNYTFPLHRDSLHINPYSNITRNAYCEQSGNQKRYTKQYFLLTSKKIKHSAEDNHQNFTDPKSDLNKKFTNNISNVHLRQYEQLVIMKKYPYLDVKELEMKYRPSYKNVRHSSTFDPGLDIEIAKIEEPSISEQEWLNVEISNRGLSGVAIPSSMRQGVAKLQPNSNIKPQPNLHRIKAPNIFESLKRDVLGYLDAKRI